ncbi:MAG: YcjF family protein [Cyanobacteriota bacterium]
MSRGRLLLLLAVVLGALLAVSLILQTLQALIWQLSYWLPPGLVGPLLLVLLAALVVVAWPLLAPWLRTGRRTNSGLGRRPPPGNRQEAARQQLEAIDRQLQMVDDAIAREALAGRRREVAESLDRGDLLVVVFGTGSSGKTSLIRALLDEPVGQVGAAMGSTDGVDTYRLQLQGVSRALRLRDTPGILEAGCDGVVREEMARGEAARADLLLFVVDGDLRASEIEVLRGLANLGKRLLLVLNKCDLRGEAEERRLLSQLRRRCEGMLAPEDVVPASSAPQTIPRPGRRPLQPLPEIAALLRRLAQVLREEGEELLADNLLLQSRQLAEASQQLIDAQRRRQAEAIVSRYGWIASGVIAVTPLPGLDLLGTAAVNAQMVVEIGQVFGVTMTREEGRELALSLGRTLASLGVVQGGAGLVAAGLSLHPLGLALSKAVQAVTAAFLTRLAGRSFITYFGQQQDWGDGGMAEVVRRQYDLDRREEALRSFLQAALEQVVEPLRRRERQLPPQPGPRGAEVAEDRGGPAPRRAPDRPGPEPPRSRR